MATQPFFNPMQYALKPLLEKAMADDKDFADEVRTKESRSEKPKSLGELCEYVLGEAYDYANKHKDGNVAMCGMPDSEMISLIKHYYDEDDIKIKKMGAGVSAKVSAPTPAEAGAKKEEKAGKKQAKKEESAEGDDLFGGLFE